MVTTVGTSSDMKSLIENFILLERDALAAYETTLERLESPEFKAKIEEFRADHLRHLDELTQLAARHGADVPQEGDMKQMLTTGKIKLADMVGDDATILRAMSTNETDTVSAYEKGSENAIVPAEERSLFQRALEDERRHKEWMERMSTI
jgi:rubrerythrin